MLTVTTQRFDAPAPRISFGRNWGILATLVIMVVAVSTLIAHPHHFAFDQWYAMSTVEGVVFYMPFATEEDCRAASRGVDVACVAGAELDF